jgi:hypothetical protein
VTVISGGRESDNVVRVVVTMTDVRVIVLSNRELECSTLPFLSHFGRSSAGLLERRLCVSRLRVQSDVKFFAFSPQSIFLRYQDSDSGLAFVAAYLFR